MGLAPARPNFFTKKPVVVPFTIRKSLQNQGKITY